MTMMASTTLRSVFKGRVSCHGIKRCLSSSSPASLSSLFNPTEEHKALRDMLKSFVEKEVEPQALEYNKKETFNVDLFRKLGNELGILGLTVDEEHGGTAFDATAVALVHEELSYSDPAFCLSYLAHSLLFVNNLSVNGNESQKQLFLPSACDGSAIGGMGMSEPNAGTDVLGMRTNASLDEMAGGWILNGNKVSAMPCVMT
jgi:isovaleryl-CoA dehydrogenase